MMETETCLHADELLLRDLANKLRMDIETAAARCLGLMQAAKVDKTDAVGIISSQLCVALIQISVVITGRPDFAIEYTKRVVDAYREINKQDKDKS